MKTTLKFYKGLEGSGVVASISYGKSRVIFDFGAPFTPTTQPFDGQVEPRKNAWVRDAVRLGQIPPIDGIFQRDDLGNESSIEPFENSELTTGVIISHLHLDHMSGIGMVHPEIPVHLHREGYELQLLLNNIGESVGDRDFTPIDLYEPFMIGEITVTAYFSDHPCAGAVGYLIETPDMKTYYSGDVRMHGGRLDRVIEDMRKIAEAKVDLLILESTTFSPSKFEQFNADHIVPSLDIPEGMVSEKELLDRVQADLVEADELGVFNIYHRDMELIKGLFDIAVRSGRDIVFEPKTAYIVMNMLERFPKVYVPDNEEYREPTPAYLQEVLDKAPQIVNQSDILKSPGKFFVQNSYENILELFDLATHGARYYHLYGVPLVSGSAAYDNMMRVLKLTGTSYAAFANLYCYNHAYPNNLLYMAEEIKARNLIAVHSSNPEKLVSKHSRQVLPKERVAYEFDEGYIRLKER